MVRTIDFVLNFFHRKKIITLYFFFDINFHLFRFDCSFIGYFAILSSDGRGAVVMGGSFWCVFNILYINIIILNFVVWRRVPTYNLPLSHVNYLEVVGTQVIDYVVIQNLWEFPQSPQIISFESITNYLQMKWIYLHTITNRLQQWLVETKIGNSKTWCFYSAPS